MPLPGLNDADWYMLLCSPGLAIFEGASMKANRICEKSLALGTRAHEGCGNQRRLLMRLWKAYGGTGRGCGRKVEQEWKGQQ